MLRRRRLCSSRERKRQWRVRRGRRRPSGRPSAGAPRHCGAAWCAVRSGSSSRRGNRGRQISTGGDLSASPVARAPRLGCAGRRRGARAATIR